MEGATETRLLNILDPEFVHEARDVADAREAGWYAQCPLGPIVLRHAEAHELLADRRFVFGGERYMQMLGVTEGPLHDWYADAMMSVGIEDHTRLRKLVQTAFTPRIVETLRPFVHTTIEHLAGQIADADVYEFVDGFAEPVPARVMCKLLGVPVEDYDRFHDLSIAVCRAFSRLAELPVPQIDAAILALSEYIDSLIERRRSEPGNDLVSSLIAAEQNGAFTSATELPNLVLLLVGAGQDTTARQLGRALVAFSQHPDQWELLAKHPELAPQAVEEVCRWSPQVRTTWRFATEDLEYRGLAIPAETIAVISVVSANRDPRAFDDPERFDITVRHRSRHLGFGVGMYYCLGAAVARLEVGESLSVLARHLGPPQITGEIKWRAPLAVIHGPEVLPLRFAARS